MKERIKLVPCGVGTIITLPQELESYFLDSAREVRKKGKIKIKFELTPQAKILDIYNLLYYYRSKKQPLLYTLTLFDELFLLKIEECEYGFVLRGSPVTLIVRGLLGRAETFDEKECVMENFREFLPKDLTIQEVVREFQGRCNAVSFKLNREIPGTISVLEERFSVEKGFGLKRTFFTGSNGDAPPKKKPLYTISVTVRELAGAEGVPIPEICIEGLSAG